MNTKRTIHEQLLRLLPLALTVLALAATLTAAASEGSPSPREDAEVSPLQDAYQLWGWNLPRYYYYLYVNLFNEYPWVVKVSYTIILLSILGFLVLMVLMCINVYIRRRNERFLKKIRDQYLEKIKGVCYAEVENLPIDEISERIDYKEKKWKKWQLQLWGQLFIEVSLFTNTMNPNLTNIQRVMMLVGFTPFVQRELLTGKKRDKVKLLQTVRVTNMQLPNSTVAHLINYHFLPLRTAARLYYMVSSKEDPYIFFERNVKRQMPFSTWEKMEMHEIFSKIHEAGLPTPKFLPIIQACDNKDVGTFMMHEIAYWGTDAEVRCLIDYFDSHDLDHREAAFQCMGQRRFVEAEKPMQQVYYKQTEALRRTILESLHQISGSTGRCVPFFCEAYDNSSSDYTRRTALQCLWHSGPKGKSAFARMRIKAQPREEILFEHVENPIINTDAVCLT